MVESEDVSLGAAIRRRRAAMGLQQREVADRVGLAAVVYGRVELGSRPCRATELREIARALGTTTDDLLRGATPIPPEEVVGRAVSMRDAAYAAMLEYGSTAVDAITAVTDAEHGAHMDGADLDDAADVAGYLRGSQPVFAGLTVPTELVPIIRGVIDDLAASVAIYTRKGESDG